MQIIENIIFVFIIIGFLFMVRNKTLKKQYVGLFLGGTILAFTLHIILEQPRWQIFPLYVVILLGFLIALLFIFDIRLFQNRHKIKMSVMILIAILLTLTGVSKFAFPVYAMPLPSGIYPIGTESFVLTDIDREEEYADVGSRKIKIQMWYPAETTEGYDLVPWLEDGRVVARALAIDTGLPSFVLDHTELIMSHSYAKAPINEDASNYPVVIISHGWRGFKNLHTDLAEELASLGYIVIGIDHTYGSVATVFSEDEIAYLNLDALPDRETNTDFLEYANTLVNTYAGDIIFTMNELQRMNSGVLTTQFEGKLDLDNIGVIGHSTGGGADVAVAIQDDRIKALFGLDAWVEPIGDDEVIQGLQIPAVFIRSESWEIGPNNANLGRLVEKNISNTRLYQIDGTTHYDFSMAYMYSPLTKHLGMTGKLEGDYLVSILKSMITDFFDQTLKVDNNVGYIVIEENWPELRRLR